MPNDINDVPTWAVTHAEAAFRCGQTSDQIESALRKKGLTASEAAAAVVQCLESKVGREWQSMRRASRITWLLRVTSVTLAASVVVVVVVSAPAQARIESAIRTSAFLLFPLACIWFSQALGSFAGPSGREIFRPTPAVLLAVGGWLLLVASLATAVFKLVGAQN
jgi:hypothetical protein